jgi:drug/metabolite transporter (DMT)-like permease
VTGSMRSEAKTLPAVRDRPFLGMLFKVLAMLMFAIMFAAVRWLGPHFPIGEIVFFRSLFGLPVIVAAAWFSGGLSLLATNRIDSHALRSVAGVISMYCNFTAYTLLPLADVTAIGFAAPLFIVILAAFFLRERVHVYRWSAVLIGFLGVVVIIGPEARMASGATIGVMFALASAALAALAMIFLKRMSAHEHSTAIAFYFMLTACAVSIFTLPFGWRLPVGTEGLVLIACGCAGGIGQLFLTFSYRYGDASMLAPFDYTAMIWAVALGFFLFGELPMLNVWIGALIVIAAGLLILWRERRLARDRAVSSSAL